ncbi:MAG: NADH-quinone oxidoreductase subunit L [Candidatus Firestonebacteria bacterium]
MMLFLLILIPLLPFLAFVINIFFGKKVKTKAAYISITAISVSFLISLYLFLGMAVGGEKMTEFRFNWLNFGCLGIQLGIMLDGLTAVMLVVVTTVSLLVKIYSIGYMRGDPGYSRYYAYLSMFTVAMLGLVLANNFLLLFISWELVGLFSYLLIGFWHEKKSASDAGKKAFITTKVGDLGFFAGLMLLFTVGSTFNFKELAELVNSGAISTNTLNWIGVLIFCGAVGKSAQFPLHVWLPDAMEGPTPVSALIHAATMVAAGVYLVARTFFIYTHAPVAMEIVAYTGTFTAIFAASMALVANDIKRVLAFSTVSQLGYMIMALGVGGYTAGMFHLTTHAFFKALLFLGAGSVIHGAGTQDIREMGGLGKKMKITMFTFLIACLAIAGIPPFSGFYSKEEILSAAFNSGHMVIYWTGTITAFITAFYMFRLFFMAFTGKMRTELHPHESPKTMTIPLMIFALLSLVSGYLFVSGHSFEKLVYFGLEGEGAAARGSHFVLYMSLTVAVLGIVLAFLMYYVKKISPEYIAEKLAPVHKLLINKYYIDEIYEAVFIKPAKGLGSFLFKFDQKVVDGAVNGSGFMTVLMSKLQNLFDKVIVDGAVNGTGWIANKGGEILKQLQTGFVQNYILVAVSGLFVAIMLRIIFK